jgi:hypothetical protein
LAGRINFYAFIGPDCPICQRRDCYQAIPCYWRNAQELFPAFRKERIPVPRFLCRFKSLTFSLLPIQLVPYVQYTVAAIIGTLLLGLEARAQGQQGFQGAVLAVDPDSLVTPWLVVCWLALVQGGLRRAHAVLRRWFALDRIRTGKRSEPPWVEVEAYFRCLGWDPPIRGTPWLADLLHRYSRTTQRFLWGRPSQQRVAQRLPVS